MQKILFNNLLLPSVLDGTKTMTRRVIKIDNDDLRGMQFRGINKDGLAIMRSSVGVAQLVPKYHIGEIVAVAQSYNDVYEELKRIHGSSSSITRDFFHKYIQGGRMPVSNKMFVKAEAMLHQIQITDINVESLQDISDEDCLLEGIYEDYEEHGGMYTTPFYDYKGNKGDGFYTPREAFASLLDKVSGKGTWERNPWVFAYKYKLVK